ncbi:MAG: hypothetical protein U0871_10165 [Gemmataceae bacterium]
MFPLVVAWLLAGAGPAAAADPGPLFAKTGYWQEFASYWVNYMHKQNGIILLILGLGAVALLIITRGSSQRK